jgi:hypothetical protein
MAYKKRQIQTPIRDYKDEGKEGEGKGEISIFGNASSP